VRTFTDTYTGLFMKLVGFQIYLSRTLGRSETTVEAYVRDAKRYHRFLDQRNITQLSINQKHFEDFIAWLRKLELAESTIERVAYGVYRYWKYLYRQGLAPTPEPMENMEITFRKTINPTPHIANDTMDHLMGDLYERLREIW